VGTAPLAVTCAAAAASALRLGPHLPAANHVPGEQPAIPSTNRAATTRPPPP